VAMPFAAARPRRIRSRSTGAVEIQGLSKDCHLVKRPNGCQTKFEFTPAEPDAKFFFDTSRAILIAYT